MDLIEEKDLANIYIRADTRKMEIKRKYQTVLEFFADSFCFWGDVFIICQIIFTAYNKVNLDYYIEKEVFFFKGMMNAHLKFDKNSNEYKKLKKLIEKEKLIEKNNIPYPLYQRKRKESKIDNTLLKINFNIFNFLIRHIIFIIIYSFSSIIYLRFFSFSLI